MSLGATLPEVAAANAYAAMVRVPEAWLGHPRPKLQVRAPRVSKPLRDCVAHAYIGAFRH